MKSAIVNGRIFDGQSLQEQHCVVVQHGVVETVCHLSQLPAGIPVCHDLQGNTLIPGFIDIQVNGGGGVLFNNAPTVETLRTMAAAHRRFGTTGFLPTLITDSEAVMVQAIDAVQQALTDAVPGVLGIHLEGPFLGAARRGVHDAERFCRLAERHIGLLSSLQGGKTLVTLAPEQASPELIEKLVAQGVIVSVGHSDASYDQTRLALAAGATGFTHLFNAMSPLQSREPGVVGAALEDSDSWFGIIADGHHVHPAAFHIAVAAKQRGGALLVTDAMATVGSEEGCFSLYGETICVEDGRLQNSAGALAGSHLNMLSAVDNACRFAHIDWLEAVRMASVYPARALGLESRHGAIRPGAVASFNELDAGRQMRGCWVEGVRFAC